MATKYNIRLVLMFFIIFLALNTCKKADKNDVIIQGTVTEQASGNPINSAIVQITTPQEYSNIFNRTDSTGRYSLSGIDISNVTDITLTASAPNFVDISRSLKVSPGQNVTGFNFNLVQDGEEDKEPSDGVSGPSSQAASIHLLEISNRTIHISGSGGIINSVLTFEVQDSAGRPIDLNNAVDVEFSIISGPNGGEGISPPVVRTNDKGQVTSNLYSGTLPGVVQIQAKIEIEDASKTVAAKRKPEEFVLEPNSINDDLIQKNKLSGRGINKDNLETNIDAGFRVFSANASNNAALRTITSEPVAITIHGGFPDEEYFSLSAQTHNFEGYTYDNLRVPITAILADEFSNPVIPGTAVHFSTTGGHIQGSGEGHTDEDGIATVELISGDPRPNDNIPGSGGRPGYATITAKSVNKNNESISKSIYMLFSTAQAVINATPLNVQLAAGESERFNYIVTDLNGNPMAPGTTIEITADDGVKLSGLTSRTLNDNVFPGQGATNFSFTATAEEGLTGISNITIKVTSPSGTETTFEEIAVYDSNTEIEDEVTGPPTGPASLLLVNIANETINIAESGGTSSTAFTFEVQDSTGRSLSAANAANIEFSILSGPNGGENIIPEIVTTNSEGRATANLNAGNTAGVVQIQAQIQGTTIKSTPVAVTIHGGFPDQDHFTLEPLTHNNIEGFNRNGVEITYKVRVGDKFSNPVKPGTAVYFSTNGGVIEGSGIGHTDETGYTEVTLFAGNPRPANGLGEVKATTTGENGVQITETSPFIFSTSKANITIKNGLPSVEMGPDETYRIGYSVTDENGNPMAPGTQIQVAGGSGLLLAGNTSHTMSNELTPGSGITDFNFTVSTTQDFKGSERITLTVTSPSGAVTQNQELEIVATGSGVSGPPAGAATLILESLQRETINIAKTGGIVSSAFTFQVQDSSGRPLNAENPVEVEFEIVGGPEGAFIMPERITTNSTGRATASLMAGNKAGVVMIQAKIIRDELTPALEISSTPVAITIHGGFPDQTHFTIAPHPQQGSINFPGYRTFGIENVLYALVGDEFSNPVKPGTAVWFSTDGGVIQGSGFGHTDELGRVEIILLSGNPLPTDGVATVTAHTINKEGVEITTTTQVVFSTNTAIITTTPSTVDLQPDGTQLFTYSVKDENGNPMPPGTTVKVVVPERMEIMGDSDVVIGDHLNTGEGITDFSFIIRDTDDESSNLEDTIIQIVVTTPSGTVTLKQITGTRRKMIE